MSIEICKWCESKYDSDFEAEHEDECEANPDFDDECETCGGSGMIEELGDGDHFEVDVIGHKRCPECNND
jgi:hypothetical protein